MNFHQTHPVGALTGIMDAVCFTGGSGGGGCSAGGVDGSSTEDMSFMQAARFSTGADVERLAPELCGLRADSSAGLG